MIQVELVYVTISYSDNKFGMRSPNGSLPAVIKPKSYRFLVTAMFYSLRICDLNKSVRFFQTYISTTNLRPLC
jgi:hypothetical protein